MNTRRPLLTAVLTTLALVAALLGINAPAAQAAGPRLPADAATVSVVPVLQWPALDDATSYQVQVASSRTFTTLLVDELRDTPAYVFTEDVAPGTYFWRYRSYRGDTSLGVSAIWSFTRAGQAGPALVAPPDGQRLIYPSDVPTLTWEPMASIGSYEVQWADNPDFRSSLSRTTTATSFVPPELMPQDSAREMYWRVRGVASALDTVTTAWSATRSFIVGWGDVSPSPLSAQDTMSVDDAVDQVVYEWTPTPGAVTYEIQVALDQRFTTLVHPDTGIDYPSPTTPLPFIVHGTRYVAPSRYPAKSHWWRVRALDANGSPGPWSATSHFTRRWTQTNEPTGSTNADPAARPNNVTVDPAAPINEFEVTWDPVPDTTFYEVEISTDPAFHDGIERAICQTPHTVFSPAYAGLYKDALRETSCPIRVPESALPVAMSATYKGVGNAVTISGTGVAVDSVVLLYFGPGDPDNGEYRVIGVITDDPETPEDESAFVVKLTRPGTGSVEWRPMPGLVLIAGDTYYIRARAVHETLAGDRIYSVWSDQASTPGETPPGPATTTVSADTSGSSPVDEPAVPTSPATASTWTDWPVLRWRPAANADAYLVAIAKDREFTNSILTDLDRDFEYYVTRGTSFVPQSTLAENNAGGSYFWYVLPCERFTLPGDNECATPDSSTILQKGRWRSFHKLGNTLTNLTVTPAGNQPWVQLTWDDTFTSNPLPPTLGSGGFERFEVQITESTWDDATTVQTETPTVTTAELDLEPTSVYRWRVRAIDGGLLPLAWSRGGDFQMPSYPGPVGLTVTGDRSPQPCLRWDATPHASGYTLEIFRGTDPTYPGSSKVQTIATAYPSHCPTGLASGVYSWRVQSRHRLAKASDYSNADSPLTVQVAAASLVTPVADTTVDNLVFQWSPVAYAASYLVELSTDDFWTVAATATTVTHLWSPAELAPGSYTWRVTALDDAGSVLSVSDPSAAITVRPLLTLTSVSPDSGPIAGGTSVVIEGRGFAGDAIVTFGGLVATVTEHSGDKLTVTTPAHAAGPVDVLVENPGGRTRALTKAFTYIGPPIISSVTPNSGSTRGETTVTIAGSKILPGARVLFGDQEATVKRNETTRLTVTTPVHEAGSVGVTVINPDGQSATLPAAFTYLPAPEITTISPHSGPPQGGTQVTISGTAFDSAATVTFDGLPALVLQRTGSTSIVISTPAHAVGAVDVTVTNPDGVKATEVQGFSYGNPPVIDAVTPDSVPVSGLSITITGRNFEPNALVRIDGTEAKLESRGGSTGITVVAPPHAPGDVSVEVENPDGQVATVSGMFRYVAAPSIIGLTPTFGSTHGGTTVTISGTGFDRDATVSIGGSPARVISRDTSTTITVATGAHGAGSFDVVVTNPHYPGAVAATQFTYLQAPSITDISPQFGPPEGETRVTIQGTDFEDNATVSFDAEPVSVVERSNTSLVVSSPPHAVGEVAVTVTNPNGTQDTNSPGFTYAYPPIIDAVTPDSAPLAGKNTITITGRHFQPLAAVMIGDIRAEHVSRVGSTKITVTAPEHAEGPVDLVVTNHDGQQARLHGRFRYIAAPVITSLSPADGPTKGGTTVTISGSSFDRDAAVWMGGVQAPVTSRNTSTGLTVLAPAHAAGPVEVVVVNPHDLKTVAPMRFTYWPPPTIAGISPDSGPTDGYSFVTISGEHFRDASVTIDGVSVALTSQSPSQLTLFTPGHAAGAATVVVTNGDGQSDRGTFGYVAGEAPAPVDTVAAPWFVAGPRLRVVGRGLRVRWSKPTSPGSPPDSYQVLLKSGSGSFQVVQTTSRRSVRLTVRMATTHWVRIMAHSASGWGEPGPITRRYVRKTRRN